MTPREDLLGCVEPTRSTCLPHGHRSAYRTPPFESILNLTPFRISGLQLPSPNAFRRRLLHPLMPQIKLVSKILRHSSGSIPSGCVCLISASNLPASSRMCCLVSTEWTCGAKPIPSTQDISMACLVLPRDREFLVPCHLSGRRGSPPEISELNFVDRGSGLYELESRSMYSVITPSSVVVEVPYFFSEVSCGWPYGRLVRRSGVVFSAFGPAYPCPDPSPRSAKITASS